MAEYIDRMAAKKAIKDKPDMTNDEKVSLFRRINAIPAADVVERKEGEWINERQEGLGSFSAECSLCGKRTLAYFHYFYCPNCGADMRPEPPKEEKMKETIIRQYRKKPVIVEAVQLDNINVPCVVRWIGEDKAKMNLESEAAYQAGKAPPVFSVTIQTLEGDMKAMPGDYIIKGVNGEFYPCKPDIFEKTYVEADNG